MKRFLPAVLASLVLCGCASQRARLGRFAHYFPYRFSGPAPAAECRESGPWRWCVDRPPPPGTADPGTILYALHYAGGSERSWRESPVARKFYALLAERGVRPPTVVAVSYGEFWTLMDAPGEAQPALLKPFVEELLPAVELALGIRGAPRRLVWGTSQGGLNGASLILRHPEKFSRAVLSCPAIYSFPLYSDAEADAYIERLGASRESVYWGLARLRPRIGGPEAWRKESPLVRVANAASLPPTMVQTNPRDEFGFMEGARRFAGLAREQGLPVTLRENGSAHCAIDAEEAASFLLSVPGS